MSVKELAATYVIVGGGIAGVSCVEGLSFLCPETKVILLSPSPLIKAVTNVVNLTQTLSQFNVEERNAGTIPDTYPSVTIVQEALLKIDPENHCIFTDAGTCIKYEKLCICTGGVPKKISDNNAYVIGLRDTESVLQFQEKVKSARRILVVGNGGIATEIVYEIQGLDIVWVIKDKHISAPFIDAGAAEFFQLRLLGNESTDKSAKPLKRMKYSVTEAGTSHSFSGAALGPDWHADLNVESKRDTRKTVIVEYECELHILTETESKLHLDPDTEWPVYAQLTNGKVFGCDLIVSATGVDPNSLLFKDVLQVSADGGVQVDWKMETSSPDIFAAGDVCTATWEKAMHWQQMRLWTQARQMGLYAAKTMAASVRKQDVLQDFGFEIFSHVTRFFGYKVVLLGLYNGQTLGEYDILLRMTAGVEYVKLVMKDGRLHGAVLIGDTDLEEMCENLILNQLDLSIYGEELLNPDIDIEDYFD